MTDQVLTILFIMMAVVALILPEMALDRKIANATIAFGYRILLLLVSPVLALLAIGLHLITYSNSTDAVKPLLGPILFVLFAVPLSILLDRLGFFSLIAVSIVKRKHSLSVLWILAALVVAVLNLDTAIVLLTPIYIDIARKKEMSPFALALQPALLSGIASLFLPISNVTNLIVASKFHLGPEDFLKHLALPGLVAVSVGFIFYALSCKRLNINNTDAKAENRENRDLPESKSPDKTSSRDFLLAENIALTGSRKIMTIGTLLCLGAAIGFTLIPLIGGAPWEIALAADLILIALIKKVPWKAIPLQIAVNVFSLAILAASFERHIDFRNLLIHTSVLGQLQAGVLAAAFSNLANNLPATLGIVSGLHRTAPLWPVLVGTNIGSLFLPGGSLAIMLWLSGLKRLNVHATGITYIKSAWPIVLPAFAAALAVLVLLR